MKTMKILLLVALLAITNYSEAISTRDLYETIVKGSVTLTPANDEAARIQLQSPIHFCTETYNEIYVSFSPAS